MRLCLRKRARLSLPKLIPKLVSKAAGVPSLMAVAVTPRSTPTTGAPVECPSFLLTLSTLNAPATVATPHPSQPLPTLPASSSAPSRGRTTFSLTRTTAATAAAHPLLAVGTPCTSLRPGATAILQCPPLPSRPWLGSSCSSTCSTCKIEYRSGRARLSCWHARSQQFKLLTTAVVMAHGMEYSHKTHTAQ